MYNPEGLSDTSFIKNLELENLPIPLRPSKPELLSPAGDWDCARAAVENGADAIYFGLGRFNARIRANNFTLEQLPSLMEYLHERGLKGYITLNTLVFSQELEAVQEYLEQIISAGADAVIVQDIGVLRLIRSLSPDFPIHASTQMSITSTTGIDFAERMGASLTALGRECSVKEIALLQQQRLNNKPGEPPQQLPLEVFIHGALCLSFSGQCLASEALGGRSANRGECAQPCRLPYQLIRNGAEYPLGPRRFLASPKDRIGLEHLPELIQSGVSCLKIEGRLKSPAYVASICRIYRQAIDKVWETLSANQFDLSSCQSELNEFSRRKRYEMEIIFSRGLSSGWLLGTDNQKLCHAHFSGNQGFLLGEVSHIENNQTLWIKSHTHVKPGDGVAFINPASYQTAQAGRVYHTFSDDNQLLGLEFSNETFNPRQVRPGDLVYKTSDPELERELAQSYTQDKIFYRRPVEITAEGSIGQPMKLTMTDELGRTVQTLSSMPLQQAHSQPLSEAKLSKQLERLGDTPFYLKKLHFLLSSPCMIPVSELNRMRRDLSEQLIQLRKKRPNWTIQKEPHLIACTKKTEALPNSQPELIVLVRNSEQMEAALEAGVQTIYCDFEDLELYPKAVSLIKSAHSLHQEKRPSVYVAPPRMFKPEEEHFLKLTLNSGADGYLVRNYDHLDYFKSYPCRGDYTLNVANHLSADYFLRQKGLQSLTLSYDLNLKQIASLLLLSSPERFEFTLHQRMPMFHTAFCFFCAYLTNKPGYPQCGKICEKGSLALKDRVGVTHPILADACCRNTVFNGRIQSACESFSNLRQLGITRFRIEFLNESRSEILQVIHLYQYLLNEQLPAEEIWSNLKNLGFSLTRGSLIAPEP
ncbi:MAG: U32 family peptidase [Verrucomicrobiae bacterium]|nr:U32 family peptidase [Verrucomicrobiae bacterium]